MGSNGEKVIIFWSQYLYAPDYTYVVFGFKGSFFMQRKLKDFAKKFDTGFVWDQRRRYTGAKGCYSPGKKMCSPS